MALNDFFTLTEMNNGLTAPSRVRELMAIMQKDKDSILKNGDDSTRQRSAVTSVIAATENTDCLDLFIQLDGLHFVDKWLKDAQDSGSDLSDIVAEESITNLLKALEKLHVDYQTLIGSEIMTTVKNLLVHNSSQVQCIARELFESWKRKNDTETSLSDDVKNNETLSDNEVRTEDIKQACGCSESSLGDASLSPRETLLKDKSQEFTGGDPVISTDSDVHPVQDESTYNVPNMVEHPLVNNQSPSLTKPAMEAPVGTTSIESCNVAVSGDDGVVDTHQFEIPNDTTQPDNFVSHEESKTSCSAAVEAETFVDSCGSQKKCANGHRSSCGEGLSCIDCKEANPEGKGAMNDSGNAIQCCSSSEFSTKETVDHNHCILLKSSIEKTSEDSKDRRKFPTGVVDDGKINKHNLQISDRNLEKDISNLESNGELHQAEASSMQEESATSTGNLDADQINRTQVMETFRVTEPVQEEANPEKGLTSRVTEPVQEEANPEKGLTSRVTEPVQEEANPEKSLTSRVTEPVQEEANPEKGLTSRVTEPVQEEANPEKSLCTFDLNQEVCSEDADHLKNQFSTPVCTLYASGARPEAYGLPLSSSHVDGNLGWKGSASTSVFRPASPHQAPESEKDISTGVGSSSSKQPIGCLGFDLNVSESAYGRRADPSSHKHVLPSLTILSEDKDSRRSEHRDLDLNISSEDGGIPLDWRIRQLFPQANGHEIQSYSSPPLSYQHPFKNFDPNDQSSFPNNSSDDSVISLLGTRVKVSRKDFVSQNPPLQNDRIPELAFDVNLLRSGSFMGVGSEVPDTNSPFYDYDNIPCGPVIPYSSTVYDSSVPVPYMVDSRGLSVPLPMDSTFSQQPLAMNMTNLTPNWLGVSGSTVDHNLGVMMGSGSRDTTSFGQFLNSSQNGKRKEPDMLEQYPFKHHKQPWK